LSSLRRDSAFAQQPDAHGAGHRHPRSPSRGGHRFLGSGGRGILQIQDGKDGPGRKSSSPTGVQASRSKPPAASLSSAFRFCLNVAARSTCKTIHRRGKDKRSEHHGERYRSGQSGSSAACQLDLPAGRLPRADLLLDPGWRRQSGCLHRWGTVSLTRTRIGTTLVFRRFTVSLASIKRHARFTL